MTEGGCGLACLRFLISYVSSSDGHTQSLFFPLQLYLPSSLVHTRATRILGQEKGKEGAQAEEGHLICRLLQSGMQLNEWVWECGLATTPLPLGQRASPTFDPRLGDERGLEHILHPLSLPPTLTGFWRSN